MIRELDWTIFNVDYNGTDCTEVYYNGVKVWERKDGAIIERNEIIVVYGDIIPLY